MSVAVLNSGNVFHICSVSNSAYRTACFFLSVSLVICAWSINCSRSSKNLANSLGRDGSNLGAARSLRIGIGIGWAIGNVGTGIVTGTVTGTVAGMITGPGGVRDGSVSRTTGNAVSSIGTMVGE